MGDPHSLNRRIGVFDSGVGGKSVVNAIQQRLPEAEVVYVTDSKNIPYGTKTPDELYNFVLPILSKLSQDVDVIVIACNTVSTTLAERLRKVISVPIIAMEPMVKPAAETSNSSVVAVCATPTTLKSERYAWLKHTYAPNLTVLEPDCSDWSSMIESNQIDREHVRERIEAVCQERADVIVLGCTHYHWIEDIITDVADKRAIVIQPEQPVIDQLERVLERLG